MALLRRPCGLGFLLIAVTPRSVLGVATRLPRASVPRVVAAAASTPVSTGHARRATRLVAQNAWSAAVDEATGAVYYYNQQTGQSQWEPPQQSYGAQVAWRLARFSGIDEEVTPRNGYTLRNGEHQVLSRWNMLSQTLSVSRKQCMVQILADGTATLTSYGKGPTLWRSRAGPWQPVRNGESLVLSDGDQVSLDVNQPEGAVFTCQDETAMQQSRGYQRDYAQQQQQQQGQQHQQQQQGQLPYPWEQLIDQSGAVYYSNPHTGEASWDPPLQGVYNPQQQGGYNPHQQGTGYY